MKIILQIACLFLFLYSGVVQSQYSQLWSREYNGPAGGSDIATVHCTDPEGNLYVTGPSAGIGSGLDIFLLKISASGNVIWERRYNGPGNSADVPKRIAADASGNVFVAGESTGQNSGKDITTLKYDAGGTLLWERRANGSTNSSDLAAGMCLDDSGNVIVFGSLHDSLSLYNFATIKYDISGNLKWSKKYIGPGGNDLASDMDCDHEGNIFVTGGSLGIGTVNDFVVVKYDRNGNEQWVKRYNGPANGNDFFTFIAVDNSGNAAVTGSSVGIGSASDYATLKYSPAGDVLWTMRYTGPANSSPDEAKAICTDATGNVFVTGSSVGSSTSYDFATVKYSPSGEELWVRRYNGTGNLSFDEPRSVCTDISGNVFVGGLSGSSTVNDDVVVIKYDHAGEQTWFLRYNTPNSGIDEANYVTTDIAGNIFVSGNSYTQANGDDMLVMKYVIATGMEQVVALDPSGPLVHGNFPNPFNPSTKIRFSFGSGNNTAPDDIALNVYDASGRFVRELTNVRYNSGVYEADFDGSGLSSGIYFCTITTGNKISGVIRMNLLK